MLIIVNPAANQFKLGSKWLEIEKKIKQLSIDYQIMTTTHPGHSKEIAYEATNEKEHDIIICAGGDGTAHNIANGIIQAQPNAMQQPKFGVLPIGTSNDYCISLGIPENVDDALKVIQGENTNHANTILCQGDDQTPHHNINLGQVGIVSAISYGVTILREKPIFPFFIPPFSLLARGLRRNTLVALKYIFWKYSNIHGSLKIDNEQSREIHLTAFAFGVGNTMSHYYFCPNADLFGEEFEILLADGLSKFKKLGLISSLKKKDYRNVELLNAKKAEIELENAITGDADGELFAENSRKFSFELKKKQLNVIIP